MILFNLCGHGHFDLSAYEKYLAGTLEDYEYPDAAVKKALRGDAEGRRADLERHIPGARSASRRATRPTSQIKAAPAPPCTRRARSRARCVRLAVRVR